MKIYKIPEPALLHLYQNGNYDVKIYSDGTKVRTTEDDEFIAQFPENIDCKITNKCSFLDDEDICHYDEYMGKRKKRGLFVSSVGCMLNADINGAANILRRGLGKTFSPHKSMFNPIKIDIEKKHPMSVSDQGVEGGASPIVLMVTSTH